MIRRLRAIVVIACAVAALGCGVIGVACRGRIVTLAHVAWAEREHYFLAADRGRLVVARQTALPPTSGSVDVSRYATMAVKDMSFIDQSTHVSFANISGMMTVDFSGAGPFFAFDNGMPAAATGMASLPVRFAAAGASLWVIAALLATPPIVSIVLRVRRRRRMRPGCCPHCGYDLRATPDRCPECGATPEAATK